MKRLAGIVVAVFLLTSVSRAEERFSQTLSPADFTSASFDLLNTATVGSKSYHDRTGTVVTASRSAAFPWRFVSPQPEWVRIRLGESHPGC